MTIVLFDDERSFVPGFRDDALVVRSVYDAEQIFPTLKVIDELWLDFVLFPGSTVDALHLLAHAEIKKAIFHSSSLGARSLIESKLRSIGFEGKLDFPPMPTVFQPRTK